MFNGWSSHCNIPPSPHLFSPPPYQIMENTFFFFICQHVSWNVLNMKLKVLQIFNVKKENIKSPNELSSQIFSLAICKTNSQIPKLLLDKRKPPTVNSWELKLSKTYLFLKARIVKSFRRHCMTVKKQKSILSIVGHPLRAINNGKTYAASWYLTCYLITFIKTILLGFYTVTWDY